MITNSVGQSSIDTGPLRFNAFPCGGMLPTPLTGSHRSYTKMSKFPVKNFQVKVSKTTKCTMILDKIALQLKTQPIFWMKERC